MKNLISWLLVLFLVFACKTNQKSDIESTRIESAHPLQKMQSSEDKFLLSIYKQQNLLNTVSVARFKDTIKLATFGNTISDKLEARRYDPSFFTLAGVLASSNYQKQDSWKGIDLPAQGLSGDEVFYQKPVKVWVNERKEYDHIILVLGSTYTNWSSGAWIHQIGQGLEDAGIRANLVYFPGFLSTEFLAHQPKHPPLVLQPLALDLYKRVRRNLFESKGLLARKKKISIIGLSGGATLAVMMLNLDRLYAESEEVPRLFNSGAMAFSPIIDLDNIFFNLDAHVERVRKERPTYFNTALTSTSTLARYGLKLKDPFNGLKLTQNPESEDFKLIRDLFFNQFYVADLWNASKVKYQTTGISFKFDYKTPVLKSVSTDNGQEKTLQGSSYYSFYKEYAYQAWGLLQKQLGNDVLPFENLARLDGHLNQLKDPVYMVFAYDDPILGVPSGVDVKFVEQAKSNLNRFKLLAEKHPSLRFFAPEVGGHLGYMLDYDWMVDSFRRFLQ